MMRLATTTAISSAIWMYRGVRPNVANFEILQQFACYLRINAPPRHPPNTPPRRISRRAHHHH